VLYAKESIEIAMPMASFGKARLPALKHGGAHLGSDEARRCRHR
jgi:hypothetical protein